MKKLTLALLKEMVIKELKGPLNEAEPERLEKVEGLKATIRILQDELKGLKSEFENNKEDMTAEVVEQLNSDYADAFEDLQTTQQELTALQGPAKAPKKKKSKWRGSRKKRCAGKGWGKYKMPSWAPYKSFNEFYDAISDYYGQTGDMSASKALGPRGQDCKWGPKHTKASKILKGKQPAAAAAPAADKPAAAAAAAAAPAAAATAAPAAATVVVKPLRARKPDDYNTRLQSAGEQNQRWDYFMSKKEAKDLIKQVKHNNAKLRKAGTDVVRRFLQLRADGKNRDTAEREAIMWSELRGYR